MQRETSAGTNIFEAASIREMRKGLREDKRWLSGSPARKAKIIVIIIVSNYCFRIYGNICNVN
jgi:hypothetical protein